MPTDTGRAASSKYDAQVARFGEKSRSYRTVCIGKKPGHQRFSSRAQECPPCCYSPPLANKAKPCLMLQADWGIAGRLGQGGR